MSPTHQRSGAVAWQLSIVRSALELGSEGCSASGLVWSGLVWSGLVWSGLVWSGLVWSGLVWSGLVWSGLVWSGLVWSGLVWSGLVWSGLVWSGLVWSGLVWSGLVWSGLVWSGQVWSGREGRPDPGGCSGMRPCPPPPQPTPTDTQPRCTEFHEEFQYVKTPKEPLFPPPPLPPPLHWDARGQQRHAGQNKCPMQSFHVPLSLSLSLSLLCSSMKLQPISECPKANVVLWYEAS